MADAEKGKVFLGLDVGTRGVRAGLFDADGNFLGSGSTEIELVHPLPDFAQYRSKDIWNGCAIAVGAALVNAGVEPARVAGIGFDATCSLVVVGADGLPVSVDPDGAADQDVICWMDHRAVSEAEAINATGHPILSRTGGKISPEMQLPKLLWLKRHLSDRWAKAEQFYDLPDWLVHKATGTLSRSVCSPVCKWTYRGELGTAGEGWDSDFLRDIGLGDFCDDGFARIGSSFGQAGAAAGGLTAAAATHLGLPMGTPVAFGAIDAYAGALGTLGSGTTGALPENRVAVIAGTSICHIASTAKAFEVPGVWGPYASVLVPGAWANEGGQSAGGALIDRVVRGHPAFGAVEAQALARSLSVFQILDEKLSTMHTEGSYLGVLAAHIHVQPDFLGNRSPLAEPWRKGAITGLTLADDVADLALLYLAAIQALSYGTRHILEAMATSGLAVSELVVSGGLAKNAIFLRQLADATGCRLLVPASPEPVLLGAAMMAGSAAGAYASLEQAMSGMSGAHTNVSALTTHRDFHDKKYRVYLRMQDDFVAYRRIMTENEEVK